MVSGTIYWGQPWLATSLASLVAVGVALWLSRQRAARNQRRDMLVDRTKMKFTDDHDSEEMIAASPKILRLTQR
ncbi:MAG TPA: hypothetical protein VE778_02335 [Candidatus Bathyarchaeia archaeon]|nr:hypothetical protein [Candidatus Bathyarchaeia archaeon]